MSTTDIISSLQLVAIVCGGAFALYQWVINMRLKRAEYIKLLIDSIRTDKNIVFYKFEYGEDWYDYKFHNSGGLEKEIDYTLSFFSYICYLKDKKIIGSDEFDSFKYEVERVITNPQCQDYCYNLYHFSRKQNNPIPFKYLIDYAIKNDFLPKEFYDSTSYQRTNRFHKYLNF